MLRVTVSLILLLLPVALAAQNQAEADRLVGTWTTEGGKARVNVFRTQSGTYVGKIVWLRDSLETDGSGRVNLDDKHPDAAEQTKPLKGKFILKGFAYEGDNVWEDGTIYDPESGSTYDCIITMESPNRLKIRGYVGISLLGRTSYWTR